MSKKDYRQLVVSSALSYVGTVGGKASGDDKFIKFYNDQCRTTFSVDTTPWCAIFCTYVLRMAGVPTTTCPNFAGCTAIRDSFLIPKKIWKLRTSGYKPKPGDLILFDWNGNMSNVQHVGLVEKCEGNTVYTIEGNSKGGYTEYGVRHKSYQLTSQYIVGYGALDYEGIGDNATCSIIVNTMIKPENSCSFDAVVTASSLNVRYGPGENYNIITGIRCGTKVKVTGTDKSGAWYYHDKGWCSAKYMKKEEANTTTANTTTTTTATTSNSSDEVKIWDYLMGRFNNAYAVAGIMGNLYAESGLRSNNVENQYEKKVGSDEEYTKKVDNGTYKNFVKDAAGYGLAQWTYWSRKQALYDLAKARNVSISNIDIQLEHLVNELNSYGLVTKLTRATSVRMASDIILLEFEKPANMSESVKVARCNFGAGYYNKYCARKVTIVTSSTPAATVNTKQVDTVAPKTSEISALEMKSLIKTYQNYLNVNVIPNTKLAKLVEDGSFGPATKKASIMAIQIYTNANNKKANLEVDGSFGPLTKKAVPEVKYLANNILVIVVKGFLTAKGYKIGTMNTKYDLTCYNTVKRYQTDNNIGGALSRGKVDETTWEMIVK